MQDSVAVVAANYPNYNIRPCSDSFPKFFGGLPLWWVTDERLLDGIKLDAPRFTNLHSLSAVGDSENVFFVDAIGTAEHGTSYVRFRRAVGTMDSVERCLKINQLSLES